MIRRVAKCVFLENDTPDKLEVAQSYVPASEDLLFF